MKNFAKKLISIFIIAVLISFLPRFQVQDVSGSPQNIFIRTGKASWYSRADRGIKTHTASNEIFDDNAMTCAMWGVAFDRKIKVTNKKNGKSVVLRVNDRGPHERFIRQGRVVDLTKAAFKKLSPTEDGLIEVVIEFL